MIIKKQENPNLNETTNIEITQILELSEKDFKAAIIKMFQQAVMNMLKWKNIKSHQRNRNIKKNQIEILELKNAILNFKNKKSTIDRLNSNMKKSKELENRIEITQSE